MYVEWAIVVSTISLFIVFISRRKTQEGIREQHVRHHANARHPRGQAESSTRYNSLQNNT